MNDKYILKGHRPVIEKDLLKWGRWFETANRHVGDNAIGEVRVSTVFLGLDHSFSFGRNKPILFETMIFGGRYNDFQKRYATWEEAEVGHRKAVALVKKSLKEKSK